MSIDLKYKPVSEQKDSDVSNILKARDEEIKNSEKTAKNLFFEYEKLQKRLEKMNDTLY